MHLVHRDKPLRRRTKDHRIFATPAVWIAVVILFTEKQHAAFAHEFDNRLVCVKHSLAGEVFDFGSEAPGIVDRAVDLQTIFLADHKVVVTMTRRSVYTPGSGFAVG